MKFSGAYLVALIVPASLALPASVPDLDSSQVAGSSKKDVILQFSTDAILFNFTMAQFITARRAKLPIQLDWASDGCTDSLDVPLGFDFRYSCYRHDFGYRNFKAQMRFTDANKKRIDLNFRADLDNECRTENNKIKTITCEKIADFYYDAVSTFGNKMRSHLGK